MTNATIPYHILIVEDSPADITLVRMALRERGPVCDVTLIQDGAQAIAFIEDIERDSRKPGIDLVLLDLHLPLRSGEEILKRLRSTERSAQTPVIVMTSSDADQDRERAQRHAALHYFRKPSELQEFLELGRIVGDILRDRKALRAEA